MRLGLQDDFVALQDFLFQLKEVFCEDGHVEFRSCFSGGGEIGDLLGQYIADQLEVDVTMYQGLVSPSGVKARALWRMGSKMLGFYDRNDHDPFNRSFRVKRFTSECNQ